MSLTMPVINTLRRTIDVGLQRGMFRIGDVSDLARALGALEIEEKLLRDPPPPLSQPAESLPTER